ncbi:hypothetical protein BH11ACT8_BH11ACT8_11020 [soil metagenome]
MELPETALEPAAADVDRARWAWQHRELDVCPIAERPGHTLVSLPVMSSESVACVIQVDADEAEPDEATHALVLQIVGQLSRVAERERSAADLAEARDAAMAASRHKSEFLATMNHEIRTPMNGVIGLNELLLATDLDARQRRLADGLREAGLTLLLLINDILDLSKIESGKLDLELTPFAGRDVLEQTTTIIAGPAQEKRLELVVSCDPAVPSILVGDPVRLGQVLTNLASNAVKFTDAGEVVINLSLDDEQPADAAMVRLRGEVRDTGIGVAADEPVLFEAFTQADRSTTRRHGGTGLGLAISRQLVESMHGQIGVHPAPGCGSVFWFTATVARGPSPTPDHEPALTPRRVLVVDDNASAADVTVRQLAAWGLAADVACSAHEGFAALSAAVAAGTPYTQALIDLDMPDGDGRDLGRRIRSHASFDELDLVLLAGDLAMRGDDVQAAGFRTWTAKPLRPAALRAALRGRTDETGARSAVPSWKPARAQPLDLAVLVVEDNPVNQLVAQGLLEGLGCRPTPVYDGEEALAALAPGHGFDVVLMDCRMPRLDGYDATRAIRVRETGPRVPIIAMTASALSGERERCLRAGMDDFLTKPVDPTQLARALARWSPSKPLHEDQDRGGSGATEQGAVEPASPLVLDPARVDMLSELVKDGVSFFDRTRTSFVSRIDGTLSGLRVALADQDLPLATATAHQLKGSALNLGLQRVGIAAARIEEHATAGRSQDLPGLVSTLEDAVREAVDALADVR